MMPQQLESFGLPLLFLLGFIAWRYFRFQKVKGKIPGLLARGGVVVDVRSRSEFASGASTGSVNIPLDELESSLDRFSVDQPIVLCCASGARSGMALSLLKRAGFKNVTNAGPWRNTVT